MLLGSHLSVAGGLTNALDEAQQLRMDCVQVFTKNQRQWKSSPLTADAIGAWHERLARMRWRTSLDDLAGAQRVVSHNSYLINLASPDPDMWKRSVAVQRDELERCEALGIGFLVSHPGAHLGQPAPRGVTRLDAAFTPDELAGLNRIIRALDQLHAELPGYRTLTCLETTVGSGSHLGYTFEQLRFLREGVKEPERVAFCLDTCHVTAAGYDMSSEPGARSVLDEWDACCGLQNLRVVHINDSVGGIGSRIDRHAHVGQGTCGRSCFRAVLNYSVLSRVPLILETPKGRDDKGRQWDSVNLRRLRQLAAGARPGRMAAV